MAYIDHIHRCNRHTLGDFRPWYIGETRAGFLRHAFAERLRAFPEVFIVTESRVWLASDLETPEARSTQFAAIGAELADQSLLPPPRGELFPIRPTWHAETLGTLDRAWVGYFGLPAYGVHLNGYVRTGDSLKVWVAKRALGKMTYPGELDNLVAGGQPAHLGLADNMAKEAYEEAGIPSDLLRPMHAAGQITYVMEVEEGLKQDTLFCFDLELPADFEPQNTDGEVHSFSLQPIAEVAETVRQSFAYKFNCNLVVIDFLIRHGIITPDAEPDYAALAAGLHNRVADA